MPTEKELIKQGHKWHARFHFMLGYRICEDEEDLKVLAISMNEILKKTKKDMIAETSERIQITREIVRVVIWKIAQDEGGHILHYNTWVDDEWEDLLKIKGEK